MLTDIPPSLDISSNAEDAPPAALAAELAWCLGRFMSGRADEPAMRRAEQALAAWQTWAERDTIDLTST